METHETRQVLSFLTANLSLPISGITVPDLSSCRLSKDIENSLSKNGDLYKILHEKFDSLEWGLYFVGQ